MATRMSKDVETIPLILKVSPHYYRVVCAMPCLRHTVQTRRDKQVCLPEGSRCREEYRQSDDIVSNTPYSTYQLLRRCMYYSCLELPSKKEYPREKLDSILILKERVI